MKILAFDTATEYCSTALWLDGTVLCRDVHAGQTHSQRLLPQCQSLLAEAGMQLADLDGIAFGMGPGSFTGLRIACAVAQGLAFGADLRVVGVNSLQAIAAASGDEKVIACLDARMGEVYHAAYQRHEDDWLEMSPAMVCKPEQVPLLEAGEWTGCGSGFAAYPEVLAARYGVSLAAVKADIYPTARHIAGLAVRQFSSFKAIAPEFAAPLYIRNKVALKICER